METIISIMLYLSLMFSPDSYYESEYDAIYEANAQTIENIRNDAELYDQIWADFGTDAAAIIIEDDQEL
ncbi:MAG: hypothetical protein IIA45_09105 [Bacteroidetes bacterium]|nr:hypothetical protein [Bacteroidota bacterium]